MHEAHSNLKTVEESLRRVRSNQPRVTLREAQAQVIRVMEATRHSKLLSSGEKRIAQLEAMLRECEWRGASILHVERWICPICRADTTDAKPPRHNPGCELDRVLNGEGKV